MRRSRPLAAVLAAIYFAAIFLLPWLTRLPAPQRDDGATPAASFSLPVGSLLADGFKFLQIDRLLRRPQGKSFAPPAVPLMLAIAAACLGALVFFVPPIPILRFRRPLGAQAPPVL